MQFISSLHLFVFLFSNKTMKPKDQRPDCSIPEDPIEHLYDEIQPIMVTDRRTAIASDNDSYLEPRSSWSRVTMKGIETFCRERNNIRSSEDSCIDVINLEQSYSDGMIYVHINNFLIYEPDESIHLYIQLLRHMLYITGPLEIW